MRLTALLQKGRLADATAMNAETALLLGTARAGEALRLPVGRIAPDHAADLVVLDLESLSLQPEATAPKQVVYAMQPEAIKKVIVGGEAIVEDGRLLNADETEIRARVGEITKDWEPG
jgi:5-methylthioadenosine/S-adenosylhomocysteine deaminase